MLLRGDGARGAGARRARARARARAEGSEESEEEAQVRAQGFQERRCDGDGSEEKAPSIAGVFWRAVSVIRECRGAARACSSAATAKYLVSAND